MQTVTLDQLRRVQLLNEDIIFGDARYKIRGGTFYRYDTVDEVIEVLESSRIRRRAIRVDYGDVATGISWSEENDVVGIVGRSTGPIRIPLLIPHGECSAPGMIEQCIVAIMTESGRKTLYRHQHYQPRYHWQGARISLNATRELWPSPFEILAETSGSKVTQLIARFPSYADATQWLEDKRRFEPASAYAA